MPLGHPVLSTRSTSSRTTNAIESWLIQNNIHLNKNKRPQLNLMRFLFLFTFHYLVHAWRKFDNGASNVIMLRYNRNSWLQENVYTPELESCEYRFL